MKKNQQSWEIAFCGVSAALSVALMLLGASRGDEVAVRVEGGGEEQNLAALEDFFRANL